MRLASWIALSLSLTSAAVQALPQPFLPGASLGSLTSARAVVARDFDRDGDLDLAASSLANGGELVWFEASAVGFVRHPIATGLDRGVDLAAGDFDCDGDEDLVVALDLDDEVVWYNNDLSGVGWALGGTIGSGDGLDSVAVADLNGDGQLDVVGSAAIGDEILRFRNNSCASSWSTGIIVSGVNAPRELAVGDLNSDGRQDVVAAVQAQDLLAYWSNISGGSWAQVTIDAAFDSVVSTDVGDIDGDGDLDVAAAGNVADEFAWWANPGGSGAWSKTSIGLEPDATAIRLVDLDRDGDLDALTAAVLPTSPVGWYENTAGNGSAWSFHTLEVGLSVVVGLTATDLGGDGDLDVVVASTTNHEIRFWENTSTHRSAALGDYGALSYFPAYREISDWEMGDINGDGLPDLVLIDRDVAVPEAQVFWVPNVGLQPSGVVSFGFEPAITTVSTHLYEDLALGDLDGDGDLDVVIGETNSVVFAVTVCRNQLGTIPPWSCGPVVTSLYTVDGLGVGDLDGDGDLDVSAVVTPTAGGAKDVGWWELSNAATVWTQHTIEGAAVASIEETRPVDLDGDGDLDLITDYNSWYRHGGIGLPTWVQQFLPGFEVTATDVADIDRDGDLDIASVAPSGAGVALNWLENTLDSSGSWVGRTVRSADTATSIAGIRLADLDLDGDPDLVAGLDGVAGERLAWFENNVAAGLGPWTERELAQPQNIPAEGAKVFTPDLDHDGDPDVLAGREAGSYASWVNGGGQYALESRSLAPATVAPGAELALLALDATHRGRSGEAAIELAALALTFEETGGGPLASSELFKLVAAFRLYQDDGSGSFEPALDTLVAELMPPLLTNGLGVLTFADGEPALALQPEAATTTYFLTAEITTTALNVGITDLEVSHEPALGTVAENAVYDLPVTREAGPGVTAAFTIADPFLFADGFESGDMLAWALVFP